MSTAPPQLMPASRGMRRVILIVLFLAALVLRLVGITAPPTEFHPMRQYRAAIIARGMYYQANATAAPDAERSAAIAAAGNEPLLEPRVIETVAFFLYQLAGSEQLWLPRLFSALCWLAAGYMLYRLARKLFSEDSALIAVTFFLLNPFTVLASRVLQPDPLMILLMLSAINLMLWYDDAPTWRRLVIAAAVAAVPPLIKPISVFGLGLAFAALSFYRQRSWRGLFNTRVLVFGLILCAPMLLYYLAGFVGRADMTTETSEDVIPSLLFQRSFYGGWFTQISKAIGPVAFLAAVFGFALMKQDRARVLVTGLFLGYLVMGLIFTYTISTHDYYQLQLVPIVCLCLGPILTPILERVRTLFTREVTRTAFVALLVVILAQFSAYENFWRTTFRYYYQNTDPAIAKIGPQIGQAVDHSTHVLMLADSNARPLMYYARISGEDWPYAASGDIGVASGFATPDASSYLASAIQRVGADYFVVVDFGQLEQQPGLKALLKQHAVVVQTPAYSVYDLRKRAP